MARTSVGRKFSRASSSVTTTPSVSSTSLPTTAKAAAMVMPPKDNMRNRRSPRNNKKRTVHPIYSSNATDIHSNDALTPTNHNDIPPPSVLITLPPPQQPLLLEGDEMFISQNGKSHTVYQLKDRSKGITTDTDIILQEIYDIEHARKTISLLRQEAGEYSSNNNSSMSSSSRKNSEIFSFDLQEINHGVLTGCGTGSMSWDSSIGKMISHHAFSFVACYLCLPLAAISEHIHH